MSSEAFCVAYARHRAREGRSCSGDALASLPYMKTGPLARQWAVKTRSYEALDTRIVAPMAAGRRLDILDIGAGNGWLCHRLAQLGHACTALDMRDDEIDGLGAARMLARIPATFACVTASFDDMPLKDASFDLAIFNAALHYSRDLARTLQEARRVLRPGGMLAVLDSPFYAGEADGLAMVAEKKARGTAQFGEDAAVLLGQNFIEFLTPKRLVAAAPDLAWQRHRVIYPLWYELRPLMARLKGARPPSRFDIWTART